MLEIPSALREQPHQVQADLTVEEHAIAFVDVLAKRDANNFDSSQSRQLTRACNATMRIVKEKEGILTGLSALTHTLPAPSKKTLTTGRQDELIEVFTIIRDLSLIK